MTFAHSPLRVVAAAACIALAITPSVVEAQVAPKWRGVARLGLEMGGDKVVGFEYEDGSSPDVTAGGGGTLTGGVVYRALTRRTHAMELQGTVGVKYRTIPEASNQTATWLRFPVEAIAFYRNQKNFRVGAGVTAHLANTLKASGEVLDGKLEFETTPGFLVQAEYLRNDFGVDLRYTVINYDVKGAPAGAESINASNIGLGFSYFFPKVRK